MVGAINVDDGWIRATISANGILVRVVLPYRAQNGQGVTEHHAGQPGAPRCMHCLGIFVRYNLGNKC